MKITVIGNWGGFPRTGQATSGYLIEHNSYKLLLECGSGVVSSLQKNTDLGQLDSVLITHYHYDHFCDIGPLQYARQIKTQLGQINECLPIYAPQGDYFKLMDWENYTKGFSFDEKSILNIGPFRISFIKNNHPIDCYSVRIEFDNKIVSFTSDTSYFDKLIDFYKDSDLLISECSFYAHMDGTKAGHLNSAQAGMLAYNANVKKLMLTHLPHFGELNDLKIQAQQHYKGETIIAEYMMEVII